MSYFKTQLYSFHIQQFVDVFIIIICLLSPLYRVFTLIYLKQTMSVGFTVLQLFCSYNYAECFVLLH